MGFYLIYQVEDVSDFLNVSFIVLPRLSEILKSDRPVARVVLCSPALELSLLFVELFPIESSWVPQLLVLPRKDASKKNNNARIIIKPNIFGNVTHVCGS